MIYQLSVLVNSRTFILVCFLTSAYMAVGQRIRSNVEADTLGSGVRIEKLIRMAYDLRTVNFDSAMAALEIAYHEVEKTGDRRRYALCEYARGGIFMNNGRPMEGLPYLKNALKIALELKRPLMERNLLNLIFSSYMHLGHHAIALPYGLRFLEKSVAANDSTNTLYAHINLGLLYYKMRDAKMSLHYYRKALKLCRGVIPDPIMLINMGLAYSQLYNYDSAFICYNRSRDIKARVMGNPALEYHVAIGTTYMDMKSYDSAIVHMTKAASIAERRGDFRNSGDAHVTLATIYDRIGYTKKSLMHISQAEKLARDGELLPLFSQVYEYYINYYSSRNEFVKTAFYQEKYRQLWREIYGEDVVSRIALAEIEFKERESMLNIFANGKLVKSNSELVRSRESVIYLFWIISFLCVGSIGVLWKLTIDRNRLNRFVEDEIIRRTISFENQLRELVLQGNTASKHIQLCMQEFRSRIAAAKGYMHLHIVSSLERDVDQIPHQTQQCLEQIDVEYKLIRSEAASVSEESFC